MQWGGRGEGTGGQHRDKGRKRAALGGSGSSTGWAGKVAAAGAWQGSGDRVQAAELSRRKKVFHGNKSYTPATPQHKEQRLLEVMTSKSENSIEQNLEGGSKYAVGLAQGGAGAPPSGAAPLTPQR